MSLVARLVIILVVVLINGSSAAPVKNDVFGTRLTNMDTTIQNSHTYRASEQASTFSVTEQLVDPVLAPDRTSPPHLVC